MNNINLPNFFISDSMTHIVFSSYLQDYYIFFFLLLSGYIAIYYFLGYLFACIPYINKAFNFQKSLAFLVISPLLIILVKSLLLESSINIFLEKNLFITILFSLSILVFVYAGTKKLFNNEEYGLIKFYNDYALAIVIIIFSSYYYYKTQANNNIDFATQKIQNKIHKDMRYLQTSKKN
jgi:hypothetical protein